MMQPLKFIHIIILFALLLSQSLFAASKPPEWKMKRLAVHGAELVRAAVLRNQLVLTPSLFKHPQYTQSRLSRDTSTLKAYYRNLGYFKSTVRITRFSADTSRHRISIIIGVEENARATMYAIRTYGFDPDSLADRSDIFEKITVGAPCDQSVIEAARVRILNAFYALGFLEATVETGVNLNTDSTQADISFVVHRGELIRVARIDTSSVHGNVKVRSKIVLRECDFKKGDILTQERIRTTVDQLYRTSLFDYVTVSVRPRDSTDISGLRRIDLMVQEKKFFAAEIGLGLNNRDSVKIGGIVSPRISGKIGYNNYFGLGVKNWLSAGGSLSEQDVRTGLGIPRIFGLHVSAESEFSYVHELNRTWDKHILSQREALGFRPFKHGAISVTHTLEAVPKMIDFALGDTRRRYPTNELGTGLSIDTRNDVFAPRHGIFGNIDLALSGLNRSRSNQFVRMEGGMRLYHDFGSQYIFASAVRFGAMNPFGSGDSIPRDKFFTLGGAASLRGFEEGAVGPVEKVYNVKDSTTTDVISGNAFLVFNVLEVRFPIYKILTGAVFVDAGNLWKQKDQGLVPALQLLEVRDMAWSMGLGFRLKLPIGRLRFDIGLPFSFTDTAHPDYKTNTSQNFSYHIAMGEAF